MNDVLSWRVNGYEAKWQQSDFEFSIDANQLLQGMHQLRFQQRSLSNFRLLRLALPDLRDPIPASAISEVYARGNDLIASYLPVSSNRFAPQVYWRVRSTDGSQGVEAMISMQTDTLESRPLIQSSSMVDGNRAWCFQRETESFVELTVGDQPTVLSVDESAPLLLVRAEDETFSYLEMAYPTDPFEFWVSRGADQQLAMGFRLLEEHLEKGVIRRFRVAAWFIPRGNDMQLAADLYRELLQADPPLTT